MRYHRHEDLLFSCSPSAHFSKCAASPRFYVVFALVSIIALSVAALTGCRSPHLEIDRSGQAAASQTVPGTDDSEAIAAQQSRAVKVVITVAAPVSRILRDDTRGLPHQKFLISLSNGTTVLVAHNTRQAPRVPVNVGDIVRIHGEYIWNNKGGLIHWTHHSDRPGHEGGFIELNGKRYE